MLEMIEDHDRTDSAEPYGILAIASSAGGISALGRVLGGLPVDFPVPVVIVQHLDPRHETIIAEVIGRRTKLPVRLAGEGDQAAAGKVYSDVPDEQRVGPLRTPIGRSALRVGRRDVRFTITCLRTHRDRQ
jgi:two-component system chemotaxis response regulator CheB